MLYTKSKYMTLIQNRIDKKLRTQKGKKLVFKKRIGRTCRFI